MNVMEENMQQSNNQNKNMSSDMQEFHNLHPNKKLTIFALIILVFIASIVFGIMINKRGSKVANTPSETEKTSTGQVKQGETALKMMVDPSSMAVNGTAKVTVMLENTAVQATDIAVNYDPTMFTATDIINGTVYDDILRSNIDTTKGQVLVNAAVSAGNPQDLRTGDVFSFTLKALKSGSGKLEFDQDLTITAKNGINTLGLAEPITITVK
jgi:hypothetical protein